MDLFKRVNQSYSDAFKKFGDSAAAVHIPKNNQSVRFNSVLNFLPRIPMKELSIADFGCGLAHLNEYLTENYERPFRYTGVEINQDFIAFNRMKHKSSLFFHRDDFFNNNERYDVITSIGTFNIVYEGDIYRHKEFTFSEIMKLWNKTDSILYLNFMSTIVDFTQPEAYHQEIGELYAFVCYNLSRKITIDGTYLPYEFSAIVKRD